MNVNFRNKLIKTESRGLDKLGEKIKELRAASKSQNTKQAMLTYWREAPTKNVGKGIYIGFCEEHRLNPLPCPTNQLERFLAYLFENGKKISTIKQAKWAVDARHKLAGHPPPGENIQIKTLIAGMARTRVTQGKSFKVSKRAALTIDDIKRIQFGDLVKGIRDKALLLVGFAGGFRRSELATIQVEDLEQTTKGINVHLAKSKSNQEGEGEIISLVYGRDPDNCPINSLNDWLKESGIEEGFIFRSVKKGGKVGDSITGTAIYLIVRDYAKIAGFNPKLFGGHSLRSGCATFLLDKGVPAYTVQKHMRHKSFNTTQSYNRNVTANDLEGVY